MDAKEIIARRAARELKDGDVVNLGIGLPTQLTKYLVDDIKVIFQSENGILGMRALGEGEPHDTNIVNAGGLPAAVEKGACFFDSCTSFVIIRGGHVDVAVLGALQVDRQGNLASHIIPGKMVPGMGGAMDLVSGAKRVIITMLHTAKGAAKILDKITLPATAVGKVRTIITEMGVMEITPAGVKLCEYNPAYSVEEIRAATQAELLVEDDLVEMVF